MKLIVSEIEKKKCFVTLLMIAINFSEDRVTFWYDKSSDESKQTKLQDEKEIIKP